MLEEDIEEILLKIVEVFVRPENQERLDNQKLASSIFYSFAIGTLKNNEFAEDKIQDLLFVIEWLQEKEDLLAGFNARLEENE